MFSHKFLSELSSLTVAIQRENENLRSDVHAKGADGKDVVSGSDLSNEAKLRVLLRERISVLAFIYGEENGFEQVSCNGTVGALIDPIDGTRSYTCRIFYSAISVAFTNLQGQVIAGYIVSINNQHPDDLGVWTFDGKTAKHNGESFRPKMCIDDIKNACISITSVSAYPKRSRDIAAIMFRLATERSRGPLSLCSGAMEILNVLKGNLGACINIGEEDIVSHAVAVEIAKSVGFHVRHVLAQGDDFTLLIDMEKGKIVPKVGASVLVCPKAISRDIEKIVEDAICSYKKREKVLRD